MTLTPSSPLMQARAFLSHASVDKPFVEVVARRLGRQRVQYDAWVFENGTVFANAIREALARSGIFVLFASKASLASHWVQFEARETEELVRTGLIKTTLVLIIDGLTRHAELPAWMQRALVERATNPNAVAREIEHHLNRLRGLEPNQLFLGRDGLLAEVAEKLIPAPGTSPPHILTVGGLSGIGRKSFLRRCLADFLGIRPGPVFHLRPTDGIEILHLRLLDELGALDTKENLAKAIATFQRSPLAEKAKDIAQMLASSSVDNVAPIIVDDGALTDSSGSYTAETIAIFEALRTHPECVVGIVHTKRPTITEAELKEFGAVFVRVPPLDLVSTKLLLTQLSRQRRVDINSDQVSELAPYLDGYPPAVNLSVSQAHQYGFAVMIADKSGLVNFKIRTFAATLEQLGLTDDQWQILRALAAEFALSLPGVSALTARPEGALASDLRHLIDLNLIVVAGNLFAIASPIRAAVQAVKGTLGESDFTTIGSRLKATFWDGITTLPPIEIIEATIHAVLRSANPDLRDFKGFVLPSVLYRAAKEYYDRGGRDAWEIAQRYTEQLLQISPEHRQGLILKAKTHVRLSEWSNAGATIETIKRLEFPEYHYLAGFMLWKKREFARAVSELQNALRVGQESMEIYHGLAWCYVRLDRLEDAEKTIRRGLKGRRQTSLLLDLAAHIAIIRHNYSEAEEYIDRLHRVRAFDDHAFRLATLWKAKKEFRKALPLLEQAVKGPRLRFEIKATLIDTVVELRDFPRATQLLDELDQHERHGRDQKSVRIGLRCKLNLRKGNWREAERLWQSLEDRKSPVHVALHTEILEKKISDLQTSPGDRAAARETLASLRSDPATAAFFDIEIDSEATEDDDEREPT